MRTVCLWCPDWPVVSLRAAERAPLDHPVVVLDAGRVRAVSAEARRDGVRRGMRRREAEARAPGAAVVEADEGLEARVFEVVTRALDAVTPRLAVDRPGLCSFPAGGPSRYFGGEPAVVARALDAVDAAVRATAGTATETRARVGIAGSGFAAHLAARRAGWDRSTPTAAEAARPARIVADGATAGFLATRPVSVLRLAGFGTTRGDDLAGLLARLGIRTLGDLAALPEASVAARFGGDGVVAHRLARGEDDQPPGLEAPPPDLAATAELDPPAARVDTAAFAGKGLADRFLAELDRRGLACTRIVVEAETEHGERLGRVWRHQGAFTAGALAQRIRWQLDAWLTGGFTSGSSRPKIDPEDLLDEATGGLTLLRLVPDEVVPARGLQLGFWGEDPEAADRAARAFARLQGMLGQRSVLVPVLQGGRTPAEQVRWVPWGDPRDPEHPPAPRILEQVTHATGGELAREREGSPTRGEVPAWPGAVPAPAPARVFEPPLPARLLDACGRPVRVSGRGELGSEPARLESDVARGPITAWTGPWLHDVRWWSPDEHRRRALFQLVVEGGVAALVTVERGKAGVAGLYD